MTAGDRLVERGAMKLQELSRSLAARGGWGEQLSADLAEDAAFLRKLKPSLIKARIQGRSNGASAESEPMEMDMPPAPSGPQIPRRKSGGGGPNPLLVVGGALVLGIVMAKVVDWRGHAHPKI
jgi:hypothetical protein